MASRLARSEKLLSDSRMLPDFVDNVRRYLAFLRERGHVVYVTDGYRTREQQIDVKRRKPQLAADPGHSLHERGAAVDLEPHDHITDADLRMYDLRRRYAAGPWHVEPAATVTSGDSMEAFGRIMRDAPPMP